MIVSLVDVYKVPDAVDILYRLLQERKPHECIRMRATPSFEAHRAYVASNPYLYWGLIRVLATDEYQGAVSLARDNKVGLFIFEKYKRLGLGTSAMRILRLKFDGPFYAEINPENKASIAFFTKIGARPYFQTYEVPHDACR